MKLEPIERKMRQSVERGEWQSVRELKRERTRYARHAKATLRRDNPVKIRK